jgi:DNA polymerase-3 subunit beta
MKVRVKRDALLEAVNAVRNICADNRIFAGYKHVFLRAESDCLSLLATDSEQTAKLTISAEVEEPGEGNIHGQKTYALLRALDCEEVELECLNDKCVIRYPGGNVQAGKYEGDAPWMPPKEKTSLATLRYPHGWFVAALEEVKHAAADKKERQLLQSICIEVYPNQTSFISTNAKQLAVWTTPLPPEELADSDKPVRAVIPIEVVPILRNLFIDRETVVHIYDNVLLVESEDCVYWTRLIDEEYPYISRLLDEFNALSKHAFFVRVKKQALENAIKRVAAFGAPESPSVGLTINETDMTMEVRSSSMVSTSSETIDVIEIENVENMRVVDSPYLIFLNTNYLFDSITSFQPEPTEILIQFLAPIHGVVVADAERGIDFDSPQFSIIMPLRHPDIDSTNKYVDLDKEWKKEIAEKNKGTQEFVPTDEDDEPYPIEEEE